MPMLLSMLCLCCLLEIKDSWFLIPDYTETTSRWPTNLVWIDRVISWPHVCSRTQTTPTVVVYDICVWVLNSDHLFFFCWQGRTKSEQPIGNYIIRRAKILFNKWSHHIFRTTYQQLITAFNLPKAPRSVAKTTKSTATRSMILLGRNMGIAMYLVRFYRIL